MKLIEPMPVTDAALRASNIVEDDHPVWDVGGNYDQGDLVMLGAPHHQIFESAQSGNQGQNPSSSDGTWWLDVSKTNRWKAFDLKIADAATRVGTITYSIVPTQLVTGIAFFGLNAGSVRVRVLDDTGVEIFDRSVDLVDETDVIDWFSFAFGGIVYDTEALITGLPGYTGFQIEISINAASGAAKVGQIVLGVVHELGVSMGGTSIGIQDFSSKTRDDFGNATIIERAFVDETRFQFALNTQDARRVKRILSRVRARPAVYFLDDDTVEFGATVFGFFQDFDIPLQTGSTSYATLEIEGLV